MLFVQRYGERGPLLFMIHWLGGSSQSWTEVARQLAAAGFRCAAVDLPGFGQSREECGYSLHTMVADLSDTVCNLRKNEVDRPWLLAGHSMGGKLAALIARASEEGKEGLENLQGMILLSPSTPSPEPMKESKREEMLQSLGPGARDEKERRAYADKFIDDNTGNLPLLDYVQTRSVNDVLLMHPDALAEWLNIGSKEDCSENVGVLNVPALIMAGTEEKALGPEAQKQHTIPHYSNATLIALKGGGHLSPMERPWEVSNRMEQFFRQIGVARGTPEAMLSAKFSALIASDRTSPQTREALLQRMGETSDGGGVLNNEELRILQSLATRVIPGAGFDLSDRLNRSLAQTKHDGWRFDTLPNDDMAWRRGLASLDAASRKEFDVPFIALDATRQDEILRRAREGNLERGLLASMNCGDGLESFDAGQMRDWFEDVRGELAKLYMADPRTMEQIGFAGFADEHGFTQIRLGERDEVKD